MAKLYDRFGCNETYMSDREFYLSAGMRHCRTGLSWAICEPVDGGGISFANVDPLFGHSYDQLVTQMVLDGISPILIIGDAPDWAMADPGCTITGGGCQIDPAYYARFQAFCQAAAAHFKNRVVYWEVFNEVTSLDFYWDTSDYEAVLGYAYAGLKAGSPTCKVLLAGLVSPGLEFIPHSETPESFFARACSGTFKDHWDIASGHFYGNTDLLPINLAILLAIRDSHGLATRPFWVTETASGAKYGSLVVSPENAAKDVVKRAMYAFATGASAFYWWPMSDAYLRSDNPAGLHPTPKCFALCWCPAKVELDAGAPYVSHPRVAHTAFATMTDKIGDYTALVRINPGLYQMALPDGSTIFVAWGRGRLLDYVPTILGTEWVKVTDHLGNVRLSRWREVFLTQAPVYVEAGVNCEADVVPYANAAPACGFSSFSGAYDADWSDLLSGTGPLRHSAVVCLDPGGLDLQLTASVEEVRVLRHRRDVKFLEYQGQDVEISLVDPDGIYDPAVPGSLLDGFDYVGKKISIGSWLYGTSRVLRHAVFYLDDDGFHASRGRTTLRAVDAFSRLRQMALHANRAFAVDVTSAAGTVTVLDRFGASYTVPSLDVPDAAYAPAITVAASCLIQSWTLRFTSPTAFSVRGSLAGEDGSGTTGAAFTSTSGSISIATSFWSGTWLAGDEVTFDTVAWRFDANANLFALGQAMLIDLAGLSAGDFDAASWSRAESEMSRHVGTFLVRRATDALSFLRTVARHGPVTAYPDGEGKIALAYFWPRLEGTPATPVCGTYDLLDLDTERVERYTSAVVRMAPNADGDFTITRQWPPGDAGSKPLSIDLEGFGPPDVTVADAVAQRYYAMFREPREVFNLDLSLADLNRRLDDLVYVRSVRPFRRRYGIVISLDFDLSRRKIEAQAIDAQEFVQPPGSCGYAFCDVGHRCDDCWVCW